MTRYHPRPSFSPRSPGARLSALRRALWEEDRAREALLRLLLRRRLLGMPSLCEADAALMAARDERMEAERDLWKAWRAYRTWEDWRG